MEYRSLNDYCREKFGQKVYKIALDAGFSCPNRDGTLGTRGCIFCSGLGSGDFAMSRALPITQQIGQGKQRVEGKMSGTQKKYIAYFQAFTNTYADPARLKAVYEEAMAHPDIVGISVATRPDCLPPDVIELLSRLNQRKPVWVELGLQTIHEETAVYIRRGYPLRDYDEAVRHLHDAGLEVIVHVILGLPGETREQMLDTVRYVGQSKAEGIKLQLLHVIQGTDLARDYENGRFETLTMDEYVELVTEALKVLPPEMVIHRMTGDGDRRTLIAPLWSTDKKRVWNALQKSIAQAQRGDPA